MHRNSTAAIVEEAAVRNLAQYAGQLPLGNALPCLSADIVPIYAELRRPRRGA